MNQALRTFLDGLLIYNPVLMTFVGALLVVILPRSARSSWAPAARFGVVFFFSSLIGATLASTVPAVLSPLVYIGVALVSIGVLRMRGELGDDWMGIPSSIIAVAPLVGLQMIVAGAGDFTGMTASAGGNALGFFAAFVVIGAIRETSRISEADKLFKTNPVVIFSMAIFSLALAGFLFW